MRIFLSIFNSFSLYLKQNQFYKKFGLYEKNYLFNPDYLDYSSID